MKLIYKIDGMMCSMCECHINDIVRNNFKVKKVKSNHRKGHAVVTADEPLDEEKLKGLIAQAGYTYGGVLSCE